jgi:hypothetical protein
MFEPGMKMFRVRLTRDGEDAGTFVLPAFDVDDAIARAKDIAGRGKGRARLTTILSTTWRGWRLGYAL